MSNSFGRNVDAVFGGMNRKLSPLAGRKLKAIELRDNKERIAFVFQDGGEVSYGVEGDCCSSSWIEHLEAPDDIDGAEIVEFSEAEMDFTAEYNAALKARDPNEYDRDCVMKYTSTFRTTKGDVVLEYRNSSNGYYGGYLSAPIVTP